MFASVAVSTTTSPSAWRSAVVLAVGFAAVVGWVRPQRLPQPVIVAGLAGCLAALNLIRPKYALPAAVFGGALAGLSASLLEICGAPAWASVAMAALPPLVSMLLTVRFPRFAPADLQEEALLGLLTFSLISAVAPLLAAGWQSALALNVTARSSVPFVIPAWTLTVMTGSVFLGGAYAIWRRR